MPRWIHDRAMSLKKDMEKTYGPEKAEQVAFAVATQQAHRLGKSPKKFKSKETGKMESFGTPEGRREAKVKFDKPLKEYKKTAELLRKEARRLGVGDFLGGIDPTGGATFQYGMKDVEDPSQQARGAQALGAAGGVVGGAAVVPAAISGLIGAGKGLAQTQGGLGARLVGAGRGLLSGAAKPFRQVSRAVGAKGVLKKIKQEGAEALTEADLAKMKRFGEIIPGAGAITGLAGKAPTRQAVVEGLEGVASKVPGAVKADIADAAARAGVKLPQGGGAIPSELESVKQFVANLDPAQLKKMEETVGGQLTSGLTTLGTSGLIGGGSAALQYGKGRAAAERYMGQGLQPQEKTAMDTAPETNEDQTVASVQPHLDPQTDPNPPELNDPQAVEKDIDRNSDLHWSQAGQLFDNLGEKPKFQRQETVNNPTADKPDTPTIKVSSDVMWQSCFDEIHKIAQGGSSISDTIQDLIKGDGPASTSVRLPHQRNI